jgi:uncharacterized protein (TIGR03083 family)
VRAAAEILLIEGNALQPILDAAPLEAFDIETVCTGWSVRDVLGHCGAALTRTATGNRHGFTPEDNEIDVDERRGWPLAAVLDELFAGYQGAAAVIDAAGGNLDGVGLGEWVHGGDVREALGVGIPYASEGVDLALGLLLERSVVLERPRIDVVIDGEARVFGSGASPVGRARTDLATFVRLCGGRRPDPDRFRLEGCSPADFVLFS